MTKPKLTLALVVMSSLVAFYSCTTKNETPKPVVDQAALAALQAQYTQLATQVLGAQTTKTSDSAAMVMTYAQLQAAIANFQQDLQTKVSYSVQVFTYTGVALPGVTVKASQGGQVATATTGSNGIAVFSGTFYGGRVVCTADLTGFARLVYEADIRNNTDGAMAYSASSTVLMLPLGGTTLSDAAMETVKFKLLGNYSIVDDTLGGPSYMAHSTPSKALPVGDNGNNVKYDQITSQTLTFYVNQWSFNEDIPVGFTGWNNSGSMSGEVVKVAYEGAKWTYSAGSDGYYAVKLPTTDVNQYSTPSSATWYSSSSSIGNNYIYFYVEMSQFTHSFTQYIDGSAPYIWTGPVGSTTATYPGKPTYDIQLNFQLEDGTGEPATWGWSDWANSQQLEYYPWIVNQYPTN